MLVFTLSSGVGTAFEIIVQPGESIQDAVNKTVSGDEIIVSPGNYTENIRIMTSDLIIRSASGNPGDTIITANNQDKDVFYVEANNVTITGFSINGAGTDRAGVYLIRSSNCTIENNGLTNDTLGVYLKNSTYNLVLNNTAVEGKRGINIERSNYNRASGNTVSNQRFGIYLLGSEGNMLSDNTVSMSADHGIVLENSSNYNNLTGNIASSNRAYGIYLTDSSNNKLNSNEASGNNRGVYLTTANGNTLSNNNVLDNVEYGILLSYSSGNNISENKASNCSRGIHLSTSSDNMLSGNTIVSNGILGLYLTSTSNNNTVFNNYLNNNVNAFIKQGSFGNIWNTTKTAGTNIASGPYIGGNFWATPNGTGFSQTATDGDGDGIADGVYNISTSDYTDYLPLVAVSEPEQPITVNVTENQTGTENPGTENPGTENSGTENPGTENQTETSTN